MIRSLFQRRIADIGLGYSETLQESIERERQKFCGFFSRRELRNPITKVSWIEKLVQLHYRQKYPFGVPENLLAGRKLLEILR